MGEIIGKLFGGGSANKDAKRAAKEARQDRQRQARASSARQLASAARDNASTDKTRRRSGRKVPGANAFAFLTTPPEKLGG